MSLVVLTCRRSELCRDITVITKRTTVITFTWLTWTFLCSSITHLCFWCWCLLPANTSSKLQFWHSHCKYPHIAMNILLSISFSACELCWMFNFSLSSLHTLVSIIAKSYFSISELVPFHITLASGLTWSSPVRAASFPQFLASVFLPVTLSYCLDHLILLNFSPVTPLNCHTLLP